MEVQNDTEVPVVRPEILESFGNWMIVERRPPWPIKKTVTEKFTATVKNGHQAENKGESSGTIKEGDLKVTSLYEALMSLNEEAEIMGAERLNEEDEEERVIIRRELKENALNRERGGQPGLQEKKLKRV